VEADTVYGRRRFERLIVPGQPGEHTIPSLSFSYYDPEVAQYRTIKTEPIEITIEPSEGDTPPIISLDPEKQIIQLATGDIRHIKPVPTVLENAGSSLLGQPLYWIFWILPLLIVGGVWVWQKRRERFLTDSAYARSSRARRIAHRALAKASQSGADGYAVAHKALLGYLSDKLNRPTVGLTNDELIDVLAQHQLDSELTGRVEAVLAEVDAGRFSPIEDTAVQSLLAETRKLINDLEKSFGA
jgi:hypothetical protein